MIVEGGWLRPARYAPVEEETRRLRAGCSLCDLSPVQKWDVKGTGLGAQAWDALALDAQALSVGRWALGGGDEPALPGVGQVVRGRSQGGDAERGETLLYRLAEDQALVTVDAPEVESVDLEPPSGGLAVHVTDVTSTLAALCLVGPRSREVLGKLTPLNLTDRGLPDAACAQTQIARCHALVARLDVNELPVYRLFVTRDYAEFVWDALAEAGRDCGLTPFGMETWRTLRSGY